MALSDEEKQKVRRYMGYLGTSNAGTIALGIPQASQPLFIVESQMNRLLPEAEPHLREYLSELECIDKQIKEARARRLKFAAVDDIKFRGGEEMDLLYEEYDLWVARLSDLLAAPINPFSEVHRRINGSGITVNVPR